MTSLQSIAHSLATQDNQCTRDPLFLVQQKRRIYGFDPQWTGGDDIAWLHDGDEYGPDEELRIEAEAYYDEHGEEPRDWTRTCYVDEWVFVTACFTRKGCEDYIAAMKHRLCDPRIYVDTAYRNREWILVRESLMESEA